jgi:phage/plasmid-like protein (TIGR03299 family)
MAHEVESMTYLASKGTPWHGLGNAVADGATIDEMLVASGLDWMVHRRFLHMEMLGPNRTTKIGKQLVDGYFAVTRDMDNTVYQVCKSDYKPIQNKEIVEFFRTFCEAGEMTLDTLGALRGGAIIWGQATINHGSDFTLAGGDKVRGRLLLATSHDGTMAYVAYIVNERVVCMNTLRMAFGEQGKTSVFKIKHTGNWKQYAEQAKKTLQLAIAGQKTMHEKAQYLSESKAPKEAVRHFVYQLLNGEELLESAVKVTEARKASDPLDLLIAEAEQSKVAQRVKWVPDDKLTRPGHDILSAIVNSPGGKLESANGTWWGALNGVTYYADHMAGRSRDTALQSAWFGDKANMKDQALELAIQYAEATR